MNTEQMRQWVADEYPGAKWKDKVRLMNDGQVFAVYNRILSKKKRQSV